MPKEPKKFINPLLRPSPAAEQKPEPEQVVEKPSRRSSAEKSASPPSQSGSQVEDVVSAPVQTTRIREEQPQEQQLPSPEVSRSTIHSHVEEDEAEAEVEVPTREPAFSAMSAQSQASTQTQTYAAPYTYTSQPEQQAPAQKRQTRPKEARLEQAQVPQFPAPPPPTQLPASAYATEERRPMYERQQRPLEPTAYSEQVPERQTAPYNRNISTAPGYTQDARSMSGPLGYTQAEIGDYPSSSSQFLPSQSTAPLPALSESFEHRTGELLETTEFSARGSLRRRRGAQTFERTHERITLWIDKRLKQAFDELAYESELPKTALLNEAIADLLRKYRG
ncbi:hypothetical protein KSD_90740 [Ktedonobacter sp. SOSP1-85]|uniref:hypothetical protein n=1 Tax=Ktedonobacter sp. SOSP1-85 TaxID=2778367 RepID=UPI0019157132|nr:hypothetical protein [Ktedonobacter sp. SOSP1-85]GHO81303.1 hypothetical protein KSD_90740 [Ktedonobacter sp. SOSP1-85]